MRIRACVFCLVLVCGPSRVRAQSDSSAAPAIVFVHGRNQPVDSLDAVRNVFLGSFQRAQRDWLGEAIVPDADIGFVWYADAIDPKSDRMPTNASCNFAEDTSTSAAAKRSDIREGLEGLAKALHLDGILLQIVTADTYKYLSSTAARCDADSRLSMELAARGFANRPLIIVAHSMGGIVSLESIKRNAESLNPAGNFNILRLVTIGTQVGQSIILQGLFGSYVKRPVAEPITIRSWTNFINKDDKLGFGARESFKATDDARRPRDISINTPGRDRHAAMNYLSDRKVLGAVLWTWCSSQGSSAKPAKCATVESEGDVR